MRAKHSRRNSRLPQPGGKSASPGLPIATTWYRHWITFCLGICGIAAAAWFVSVLWRHSNVELTEPRTPFSDNPSDPLSRASAGQRTPGTLEADPEFKSQLNRGTELLNQGKFDEAVQVLTSAMQMNPQDEDVHYNLGMALSRSGKTNEAVQQYEEALRILPEYVEAHNNLGNLLMRMDRMEEAIQHFEQAIKTMPEYASAHNNLGTALQKSGRTNDALMHFQQAVKINPDYWEAHFNVGTRLFQEGRIGEARAEFETVVRLKPDFQPARLGLAAIEAQELGLTPIKR